ncbi:hypothetical protein Tco_1101456 [Tanacetum coccineum]
MEKCHFMVKEGIVLGHKISKSGIEVDKAKVDVIAKLPHPTTVKGIRSFLGAVLGQRKNFERDETTHELLSKFAKSLTFGALILWGRSRLQEGTNIYSWQSITYQNGLKQKRSPPMMPELFANFLNLSSPDLVPLVQS